MIKQLKEWLNQHPRVKAYLIVAEGAAGSFILTQVDTIINTGQFHLDGQVAKKFLVGLFVTVYLAVKNYRTVNPNQQLPPKE